VNAALADIEDVLYVNSVNQDTYNFFGISAKRRVAFEMSKVEEELLVQGLRGEEVRRGSNRQWSPRSRGEAHSISTSKQPSIPPAETSHSTSSTSPLAQA
jgi:hypothetical protein